MPAMQTGQNPAKPAGFNKQIQYNASGKFAADSGLYWDYSNRTLHVDGNSGGQPVLDLEHMNSAISRFGGFGDGYTYNVFQFSEFNDGNMWEWAYNDVGNTPHYGMGLHFFDALLGSGWLPFNWVVDPYGDMLFGAPYNINFVPNQSGSGGTMNIQNLPTSPAGLISGDLWVDLTGGLNILKVV